MMSEHQVRFLEDLRNAVQRLDALDDRWTRILDTWQPGNDVAEAVAVASEMRGLLGRVRDGLPRATELALADDATFNRTAVAVVAAMDMDDATRENLRSDFGELGWADEVRRAFQLFGAYADVEAVKLDMKLAELQQGHPQDGDWKPWLKCVGFVVVFGLNVAVAVVALAAVPVTAPAAAIFVLHAASNTGSLVLGLSSCRGQRRRPTRTEELTELARLKEAGHLNNDQYQTAVNSVLSSPA
jgi:hypothetical protein